MTERDQAWAYLYVQACKTKREVELLLVALGWPKDPALSAALDRLQAIIDQHKLKEA